MFRIRVTGMLDDGTEITLVPGNKYNLKVNNGSGKDTMHYAYKFNYAEKDKYHFSSGSIGVIIQGENIIYITECGEDEK